MSTARFTIFPRLCSFPAPSPSLAPSRFPSFFFRPPKFSNLKCHASSDRSHLCHANSSTVWIGCPRINFSRGIFWRAAFLSWQEQERRYFGWIWPSNDTFFFNGTRAKRKLTSFAVNRIIRRWNPFQAFYKKAQVWRNPLWKRGREEEKRNLGRASRSRKKNLLFFPKNKNLLLPRNESFPSSKRNLEKKKEEKGKKQRNREIFFLRKIYTILFLNLLLLHPVDSPR